MKKIITLLLALLLLASFAACGSKAASAPAPQISDEPTAKPEVPGPTTMVEEPEEPEVTEEPEVAEEPEVTEEPEVPVEPEETEEPEKTEAPEAENGISPDFKAAMDSYEEFFDDYVAFMKKYNASKNPLSMLSEYSEFMDQYAQTMEALEAWEEENLTTEEAKYLLEVTTRINEKVASILVD
ncbi:MAG: hypothetical protein IJP03_03815 [Christensenellaceae bacterium]|nr:hypothetical protein [Christensenellaceae bacterium]